MCAIGNSAEEALSGTLTVFSPPASAERVAPTFITLADLANRRQLVVCVGAGISVVTGLPSGRKLGELLDASLAATVADYVSPDDPGNLLEVADAAAHLPDGEEALRRVVVSLARFRQATPAYAHRAIAFLLIEGAMTALSWNWDTCIERARPGNEDLDIATSRADLEDLDTPQLIKVHGCASRVGSLLITSEHMKSPPNWASDQFQVRLAQSEMVFVGIGDVADYATIRIRDVLKDGRRDSIRVVSPDIRSSWDASAWKATVADLPVDRRLQLTADEFFDELSRAWVQRLYESVRSGAAGFSKQQQGWAQFATDALGQLDAVDVLDWLRQATMHPVSGKSVATADETIETILALGLVAGKAGCAVELPAPARVRVGDATSEVLIARGRPLNTEVRRELTSRAIRAGNQGQTASSTISFVVGGSYSGPLEIDPATLDDITGGDQDYDDILSGPLATRPKIVKVADVMQAVL